jgi:Zn-dependent protease
MKATVPLGRYAGIPIGAHWSVLVIVVLLAALLAENILPTAAPGGTTPAYWLTALAASALLLACLLAHELAHAALARHFGVRVERITLWALGGMATFEDDPPTPRATAVVAAAGPMVSIVLGGGFFLAAMATSSTWLDGLPLIVFVWLALTNALIGVFNLLPAAPLDGGRLLCAWLWKRSGDRNRATVTAASVGQLVGYLLIGLGVAELVVWSSLGGLWLAVIGWFITNSALTERRQAQMFDQLEGVRVRDAMTPDPIVAPGWWTVEAFVDHVSDDRVRHRVFPVVDFDGRPVGVVSLRDLATARTANRLQDTARPLGQHSVVLAGEPLIDALRRTSLRPGREALAVTENRTLVGILTATDIMRTLELSQLGHSPAKAAGRGQE